MTVNQAGGNYSTFYYAPDRSRYRQVSLSGTTTEDRTYVGGLFEKLTSSVVGVEYRHYIVTDGKKVAVRVISTTRNDTYYMHDDHLGSTGAITDQTGATKIQESFDAWGKRRSSGWVGSVSPTDMGTINATTHVGFTGQEDLDNLSLVDLNGRIYDPTIARFMSADPEVQAPYESQSLNRYSYTFDNPLNATDPTGYDADGTGGNWASYPDSPTGSHIDASGPAGTWGEGGRATDGSVGPSGTPGSTTDPSARLNNPNSAQVVPNAAPLVPSNKGNDSGSSASQALEEVVVTGSRHRPATPLTTNDYVSILVNGFYERQGYSDPPRGDIDF